GLGGCPPARRRIDAGGQPSRPEKRHCLAARRAATECGMSPPAKKPAKQRAAHTDSTESSGGALAGRIVTAPHLSDADGARAQLAQWLAGLEPDAASPLKALLTDHPTVETLLASLAE